MRVGSLFTGYGGLDMAVGGSLAWYSEIEPAACTVLKAHHSAVANLGDITTVDWSQVAPIDVLTGGYPCQPFSHAGKREGTNDPRHLWPHVKTAVNALRPAVVVLENVRGHLSLGLKEVLADLTEIGYDAKWEVVRASDAGAPHQRARVFIVAYPNGCRYGEQQDPPTVGSMEASDEGETQQRQRTRQIIDAGSTWGQYEPAITRWANVIGRSAPVPTIDGKINPVFVEWMMGLPEGHVTSHGLTDAQSLKMLGNGVVPQQAALALRRLGIHENFCAELQVLFGETCTCGGRK